MINSVRQSENRKLSQSHKSQNYNLPKRASSQFKIHYLPSISSNSTCCSNSCIDNCYGIYLFQKQLINYIIVIILQVHLRVVPNQMRIMLKVQQVITIRFIGFQKYTQFRKQNEITKLNYTSQDPLSCFNYDDFKGVLPVTINGIKILKIDWSYFTATPNMQSPWKAHCYWTVGYTFDINMRKMKRSQNIRYRLIIQSWCCLNNKSWVKTKWDRLLEHETGHYLIGCLCALDFKQKADKFKYTKNYRMECTKLFQDTFQFYLQMEKQYDEETNHSQNVAKQKEWNQFIKQELLKY